jgi:hypothetical protein
MNLPMRRPSHWILLSLLVGGSLLWTTGRFDLVAGPRRAPGPRVVKAQAAKPAAAPRRVVLRGRVIDPLGWPIEGASVQIAAGEDGLRARTDPQGAWELAAGGGGPHALAIAADGHEPALENARAGEHPTTVLARALWDTPEPLAPPPVAGESALGDGFVRTDAGAPAAGALIAVLETGASAISDDVGHFLVPLPVGAATLVARDAEGRVARLGPVQNALAAGKVPLETALLRRGHSLRGLVKDPVGEPCAGAPLVVRGEGLRLHAMTDASGGFTVQGLVDGVYEVEALPHRGWLGARRDVLVQRDVVDVGDLALLAERPRRVQVVDSEARGQSGVLVLVREQESGRRAHGRTNAEGYVGLSGIGAGAVVFEAFVDATRRPLEIVRHETVGALERLVVRGP